MEISGVNAINALILQFGKGPQCIDCKTENRINSRARLQRLQQGWNGWCANGYGWWRPIVYGEPIDVPLSCPETSMAHPV